MKGKGGEESVCAKRNRKYPFLLSYKKVAKKKLWQKRRKESKPGIFNYVPMKTDANAEAINTLTYIGQDGGRMKINTQFIRIC